MAFPQPSRPNNNNHNDHRQHDSDNCGYEVIDLSFEIRETRFRGARKLCQLEIIDQCIERVKT